MDAKVHWVHVFVDVPGHLVESTHRFWSEVTGWDVSRPWPEHPEFTSLQPFDGAAYLHVQQIEGPPRVHLDLSVSDIDREADRLAGLGAVRGERYEWWQVMTSPGGLPFCLLAEKARNRPGPTTWPAGHRSRPAQVCIDVPADSYDTEWTFWQRATGWRHEASRFEEFEALVPPSTCPVRFLVQRLGRADRGGRVRAHIDLGTDDVQAEADRVHALAAQITDRSHPWVGLRGSNGLDFCVTPRSPD